MVIELTEDITLSKEDLRGFIANTAFYAVDKKGYFKDGIPQTVGAYWKDNNLVEMFYNNPDEFRVSQIMYITDGFFTNKDIRNYLPNDRFIDPISKEACLSSDSLTLMIEHVETHQFVPLVIYENVRNASRKFIRVCPLENLKSDFGDGINKDSFSRDDSSKIVSLSNTFKLYISFQYEFTDDAVWTYIAQKDSNEIIEKPIAIYRSFINDIADVVSKDEHCLMNVVTGEVVCHNVLTTCEASEQEAGYHHLIIGHAVSIKGHDDYDAAYSQLDINDDGNGVNKEFWIEESKKSVQKNG